MTKRLFLLLAAAIPFSARATPPSPDVSISVSPTATTTSSGAGLALTLTSPRGAHSARLKVTVSEYGKPRTTDARTVLERVVQVSGAVEIPVDVPTRPNATYRLRAQLDRITPGVGIGHAAEAFLVVDKSGRAAVVAPHVFMRRQNRPGPKSVGFAPPGGYPLTIIATVNYTKPDGTLGMPAQASVEFWENDAFFDDDLGGATVPSTGTIRKDVLIPYDPFGSDEVYMVVKLQNGKRFTLGTASSSSGPVTPYSYKNGVTPVHEGMGTVNLSFTINPGNDAVDMWTTFNKFWDYSATALNFAAKTVDVWYPADGDAYFQSSSNLIGMGPAYSRSPMVMAHEYGHALMWQLNNEWFPEGGGPHSVCPGTAIGNGFAWSEGYATAFALSSTNSPDGVFHWTPGDHGLDIEHYSCPYHDLATDEMRVAAAVWDLVDSPNDDNGGSLDRGQSGVSDDNASNVVSAPQAYVSAVQGQQQEDMLAYWTQLRDLTIPSAQVPTAIDVMNYNWYGGVSTDTARCLIFGSNGSDVNPSRYKWGSGPYCGFSGGKSALLADKQAAWTLTQLDDNGNYMITSAAGTGGTRCLIFGGNGNDVNPSRYNWAGGPYCGLATKSALLTNKQAVWNLTLLDGNGNYMITNASGTGGTSCLIFGGNGTDQYPSRYNWGSGPYCGISGGKAGLLADKQAVWKLTPLDAAGVYMITNASGGP